MDAEYFFDELYSQYCVSFPCYALFRNGMRPLTEPAGDGTQALVILTDEDLLCQYSERRGPGRVVPVLVRDPETLATVIAGLPPHVTHVTFDPSKKFHRRYPVEVLKTSIAETA